MTRVDLVVVGAGPAGLTLAWKAAEKGLRVAVIDKKKTADHVAYLTSASFMDLREWGIPEAITQPIEAFHLASRDAVVTVPGSCRVINRRRLLAFLAEQAQRHGAQLLFESMVTDVALERGRIQRVTIVSKERKRDVTATIFADCSGVGRVLEQHVPLIPRHRVREAVGVEYLVPLRSEPRTLDLYFGSHYTRGYGWLSPIDDHTAILGYGTFDQANFRHAPALLDQMFEFPRIKARVERRVLERNGGIFRTGMPLKRFHRKNLIVVGDVALQGNPVIGEGIRFVMDAAGMAADAITQAIRDNDLSALSRYSTTWRDTYYHQFLAGYLTQRVTSLLLARDPLCNETLTRLQRLPPHAVLGLLQGQVTYGNAVQKLLRLCRSRLSLSSAAAVQPSTVGR